MNAGSGVTLPVLSPTVVCECGEALWFVHGWDDDFKKGRNGTWTREMQCSACQRRYLIDQPVVSARELKNA